MLVKFIGYLIVWLLLWSFVTSHLDLPFDLPVKVVKGMISDISQAANNPDKTETWSNDPWPDTPQVDLYGKPWEPIDNQMPATVDPWGDINRSAYEAGYPGGNLRNNQYNQTFRTQNEQNRLPTWDSITRGYQPPTPSIPGSAPVKPSTGNTNRYSPSNGYSPYQGPAMPSMNGSIYGGR